MKLKVIEFYLYLIIIISFLGGYFEAINRSIYHFSVIIITLISVYFSTIWLSSNKNQKIKYLIIVSIILLLAAINFTINREINTYLLFILFSTSLILSVVTSSIQFEEILRIINYTFIIYLILSISVYFNLIPYPSNQNVFYYSIFGIKYKTFIGFFGSTSAIDSYATIVFLLNMISKSKKTSILMISFLAAILPLRYTPLLIIFIVSSVILFSFLISRKFVFNVFILLIFLSFVIPKIVYILTGSDTILIILNYLSNGRVALWNDLLGEYQRASVSNMLFGFGSTDIFVLKTWDHKTSNTHNLYFTLLITYGVFIYLYLYFAVAWLLNRLKKKEGIIIIAILTAGISNSIIFSFSNIPLVLLFVYFITLSLRPIKNSGEKHLELKKT